jgi:cytoskeletal protein RodZ
MGLSLQDLAGVTKIRADLLHALEEGRYEQFTAPVYVKGSVRSYAQALKLDPAPLLRQLDAELSGDLRLSGPPPLSPNEPTILDKALFHIARLSWTQVLLGLAVVLSLALWLGERILRDPARVERALQGMRPSVYEGTVPPTMHTLSLPPVRPAGSSGVSP